MPTIVWALLCHRALLDDGGRLCLQGIVDTLTVPTLPILVREMTLVVKVQNADPAGDLDLRIDVRTPHGLWSIPEDADAIELVITEHFIFATIRSLPLDAPGVYRFEVSSSRQSAVAVEVPVFTAAEPALRVH